MIETTDNPSKATVIQDMVGSRQTIRKNSNSSNNDRGGSQMRRQSERQSANANTSVRWRRGRKNTSSIEISVPTVVTRPSRGRVFFFYQFYLVEKLFHHNFLAF